MKAQVSIEFLVLVGLGLLIISIYTLYGYDILSSYKQNSDTSLTYQSIEKIVRTAEYLYSQGEPAKQRIYTCFPLSLENCSIMNNNTILCYLNNKKEISSESTVQLNGTTFQKSGCCYINIEVIGNLVNVKW